jgi:hypothetical protein
VVLVAAVAVVIQGGGGQRGGGRCVVVVVVVVVVVCRGVFPGKSASARATHVYVQNNITTTGISTTTRNTSTRGGCQRHVVVSQHRRHLCLHTRWFQLDSDVCSINTGAIPALLQ